MEISAKRRRVLLENAGKYTLFIELAIIFIVFSLLTKGTFTSTRNLSNFMMQGVTCSIISITMMMVIVSRNADLSAGFVLGFMCNFAAKMMVDWKVGTIPTIIIVLLIGLVIGLWHGFWIAYIKLPAFIVTLASQFLFQGLILLVGKGFSIGPVSAKFSFLGNNYVPNLFNVTDKFNFTSLLIALIAVALLVIFSVIGRKRRTKEMVAVSSLPKYLFGLIAFAVVILVVSYPMIAYRGYPFAILFLTICGLVVTFVVKNTPFGRYVFAIGGNVEAAKYSGINVEKTVMMIYILHSILIAVASIVYLGRVGQASASTGTGFEFTAITGCVVGGTSILGGRGNVLGAIVGTMMMAALDNGMSLMNLGAEYQYLIKGLVLMLAIAIDVLGKNKSV